MMDQAVHPVDANAAHERLRNQLAHAEVSAGDPVLPVLRQLVTARDISIFSEEVLARVRVMLSDLAGELTEGSAADADALARVLLDDTAVLGHLHAQAIEWQLTEAAQARLAIDPAISPLLQRWLTSADPQTREAAAAFLADQAHWCQAQQRMSVALTDLPADVRAAALHCAGRWDPAVQAVPTRVDSAAHLLDCTSSDPFASLDVSHAGIALFLSGVARRASCGRDAVTMWTQRKHGLRLALVLRAAGASVATIEAQLRLFEVMPTALRDLEAIDPSMASSLLAQAGQ